MKIRVVWGLTLLMLLGICSCASHSKDEQHMLVGEVSSTQLLSQFNSFATVYEQEILSSSEMLQVAQWPNELQIDVYFGTWCHDSIREVPKLLKAIATKPLLSSRLIALDYQKSDPLGLAEAKQINFTPTFIVSLNNQELGRIVERPIDGLVTDISEMLSVAKQ